MSALITDPDGNEIYEAKWLPVRHWDMSNPAAPVLVKDERKIAFVYGDQIGMTYLDDFPALAPPKGALLS